MRTKHQIETPIGPARLTLLDADHIFLEFGARYINTITPEDQPSWVINGREYNHGSVRLRIYESGRWEISRDLGTERDAVYATTPGDYTAGCAMTPAAFRKVKATIPSAVEAWVNDHNARLLAEAAVKAANDRMEDAERKRDEAKLELDHLQAKLDDARVTYQEACNKLHAVK